MASIPAKRARPSSLLKLHGVVVQLLEIAGMADAAPRTLGKGSASLGKIPFGGGGLGTESGGNCLQTAMEAFSSWLCVLTPGLLLNGWTPGHEISLMPRGLLYDGVIFPY